MLRSFYSVFVFIFLLASNLGFAAQKWTVDLNGKDGKVEFHAVGRPSLIKINGKGDAPKGWITLDNGKISSAITFDLKSLDTGIDKRNEHMKVKYLEVEKYPEARLALTEVNFPNPAPSGEFSDIPVSFKGNLTLHGVTRPIEGNSKVGGSGGKIKVVANFETKISDYKMPVPSFSGITVADKVQIEIDFSAPLQIQK